VVQLGYCKDIPLSTTNVLSESPTLSNEISHGHLPNVAAVWLALMLRIRSDPVQISAHRLYIYDLLIRQSLITQGDVKHLRSVDLIVNAKLGASQF
jgi:hypothetical protein